jgi:hypothetical protein
MSRFSSIIVPAAEWKDEEVRRRTFREARRRAKWQCVCCFIKIREGRGVREVARVDGRFWLYDHRGEPMRVG